MGEFLQLKPNAFDVKPGTLVKTGEYAALVEAEGIVELAKQQAEQIVSDAKAAYEEEKKRGFEEGVEAGKMEMTMRMIDTAVQSVDMLSSMEEAMVDVVTRSLRTIIGDMNRKELIESLVKRSLQYVRNQKKVVIRLNPDEAEMVQTRIDAIIRDYPSIVTIDVVPDARLDPAMCILETEMGIVDASLEKQLEFIEQTLRREVGNRARG